MYVYLIFDPFSRLTKIGKSKNPKKRFEAIKTSNPNAELFFYSNEYLENELHEMFKNKREIGEWFALDKKDIFSITKTFSCIPKRLHYSNTKKDKLRTEINNRKNKFLDYTIEFVIDFADNYGFTQCKKCFNLKTNRQIKQMYNNGCIGYFINSKFYSLHKLRKHLIKPITVDTPF
jgi:hypothetical protein